MRFVVNTLRTRNQSKRAENHLVSVYKLPSLAPNGPQGKAREAEVERINARTIEDDMAEASLEELDELEDELADDGMLEKYR